MSPSLFAVLAHDRFATGMSAMRPSCNIGGMEHELGCIHEPEPRTRDQTHTHTQVEL